MDPVYEHVHPCMHNLCMQGTPVAAIIEWSRGQETSQAQYHTIIGWSSSQVENLEVKNIDRGTNGSECA